MITIKAVRRAGVPLAVVETTDIQQTITNVIADLNGKAETIPLFRWDVVKALAPLNKEGTKMMRVIVGNDDPKIATQNPSEFLALLDDKQLTDAIFFMVNAHLFWKNETVLQGIWNLRDHLKSIGAVLILLCTTAGTLPEELKQDCVILTDTLPNEEEIKTISESIIKSAKENSKDTSKLDAVDVPRVVETLLGLSAFGSEQALAMSITTNGVDMNSLWERKRRLIEQTKGLSVWRGGETFDDIGGYDNVKEFMRSICRGNAAPRGIVFIDEIEKSMAGIGGDSTGVSQDYLRALLTFMQDKECTGVIFVGAAGTGKTAIAKATGNDAGIPTIAFDMGGMKSKFVGDSEGTIRAALNVCDAVTQGRMLFIATCNATAIMPPELKRRFNLGTFYFELPGDDAKEKIWKIRRKKSQISDDFKKPNDEGWTGAEIKNCCDLAWRLNMSLEYAASFIVPVSVSSADKIAQLNAEANNKYISASKSGIYQTSTTKQAITRKVREE